MTTGLEQTAGFAEAVLTFNVVAAVTMLGLVAATKAVARDEAGLLVGYLAIVVGVWLIAALGAAIHGLIVTKVEVAAVPLHALAALAATAILPAVGFLFIIPISLAVLVTAAADHPRWRS